MSVCVCILVQGSPGYYVAARETVRSILKNSDFDLFVAHDGGTPMAFPSTPRLRLHVLPKLPENTSIGVVLGAESALLRKTVSGQFLGCVRHCPNAATPTAPVSQSADAPRRANRRSNRCSITGQKRPRVASFKAGTPMRRLV